MNIVNEKHACNYDWICINYVILILYCVIHCILNENY